MRNFSFLWIFLGKFLQQNFRENLSFFFRIKLHWENRGCIEHEPIETSPSPTPVEVHQPLIPQARDIEEATKRNDKPAKPLSTVQVVSANIRNPIPTPESVVMRKIPFKFRRHKIYRQIQLFLSGCDWDFGRAQTVTCSEIRPMQLMRIPDLVVVYLWT